MSRNTRTQKKRKKTHPETLEKQRMRMKVGGIGSFGSVRSALEHENVAIFPVGEKEGVSDGRDGSVWYS